MQDFLDLVFILSITYHIADQSWTVSFLFSSSAKGRKRDLKICNCADSNSKDVLDLVLLLICVGL